jgi:hypothetical protein
MAGFQPATEVVRISFEQRGKPFPGRKPLPQVNRTARPLQGAPLVLRLGLQERSVGGLSGRKLLELKKPIGRGA